MDPLVRKSPDFVFHQKIPPNGGPTLNRLVEEFITPEVDFFLGRTAIFRNFVVQRIG